MELNLIIIEGYVYWGFPEFNLIHWICTKNLNQTGMQELNAKEDSIELRLFGNQLNFNYLFFTGFLVRTPSEVERPQLQGFLNVFLSCRI